MIKKVVLLFGLSALGFTSANAAYHLSVSQTKMTFQAAEGLGETPQAQVVRSADSGLFSTAKMRSSSKPGTVILQGGSVKNDGEFWHFFDQVKLNRTKKQIYKLRGPDGTVYVLFGAWPTHVPNTVLEDEGNLVALDKFVLNHEHIVIYAPNEQ